MKNLRLLSLLALRCILLLGLPVPVRAQAPQYTVTVLGAISGNGGSPLSFNGAGQIVGYVPNNGNATIPQQAVVWNGITPTLLTNPTNMGGYGESINNSGQVAGYATDTSYIKYPVVWNGTTPTLLPTLGGKYGSAAYAINASGQVAGFAYGPFPDNRTYAVVWNGTTLTKLNGLGGGNGDAAYAINAAGQVVGESYSINAVGYEVENAVIWNGTTPTVLSTIGGSTGGVALAINDVGQAAGYANTNVNGLPHAVVWNGTVPTDLGNPGGTTSTATGINNFGEVFCVNQSTEHPFLYTGGTMYDLQTLLVAGSGVEELLVPTNGWGGGNFINDQGQIVAVAHILPGTYQAVLLTRVPIPPVAATLAANSITNTGATLNGTVNAGFGSTAVSFDYGLTTAYGTNVPGTPTPVTGRTPTAVSANLNGLAAATTYHFRVNGTNVAGTANGNDQTFTTQISASSQIVNVNATQYGDFTVGQPSLSVSLPAGTYLLTPVNPQLDARALYTAWDQSGDGNTWQTYLEIGLGSTGHLVSSLGTYAFAPTPIQAFTVLGNVPVVVTLAADDALLLGVGDDVLGDNLGGVSLIIQALSALQTWRWDYFNTFINTGNSADSANPYNTGIQNLAVFAFLGPNQNPATAQVTQLPQPQVSNGNYVYSFTQPTGVSGVTYGAQWTPSLSPTNWQPINDTGSGTQHIFSVPIGSNTQMFVRLTVTEQ